MTKAFLRCCLMLMLATVASRAEAEPYPSRLIKVVGTYPAGGPVDVMTRLVTNALMAKLNSTIIVENRVGAGGTLGSKYVASSSADGYTLLFASQANLISGAMYKNLDYDPVSSFTPIARVSNSSWLMVTSSTLPVHNFDEFISYAKAHPGKINFGFGLGSAPHLLGELLKIEAGIDVTSIPYKGGGAATTDLLSGQVHMAFGTAATLLPLVQDGRLRAIAVTGPKRWPELPDTPTMAEKGIKSLPSFAWTGLLGPAGLPPDITAKLNGMVNEVVASKSVQDSMTKLGYSASLGTPAEFGTFLVDDMKKWRAAVGAAGIAVQ